MATIAAVSKRGGLDVRRVAVFTLTTAAAVAVVVWSVDDGGAGLLRVAVEAVVLGAIAYLVTHIVWPRWRSGSGHARSAADREEPATTVPGTTRRTDG